MDRARPGSLEQDLAERHEGIYVCGQSTTGSVLCWGENLQAQLGDGTRVRRPVPVYVAGTH